MCVQLVNKTIQTPPPSRPPFTLIYRECLELAWPLTQQDTCSRLICQRHISCLVLKITFWSLQIWKFSGGRYCQNPLHHDPRLVPSAITRVPHFTETLATAMFKAFNWDISPSIMNVVHDWVHQVERKLFSVTRFSLFALLVRWPLHNAWHGISTINGRIKKKISSR